PGTILLLDNDYIYKYIIPGKSDPSNPYGRTTYYSSKLIYKTRAGEMYVASLPTEDILIAPKENDLRNLQAILTNLEKLKCDMYDSALVPVALVNKLVSLSNHPSSRILQRFAVDSIKL
ncbi:MAG: NurA domain-containing protein, partial [Chloroflexota bacterium]